MARPFLDTNILLRHLLQDHPDHSPRSTALLDRVRRGELTVHTSDIVVFETVFALQRAHRVPRVEIAATLLPLLELPGILLPGKRQYRQAFELYLTGPLGFADCYHVVTMRRTGIDQILSFDRGFDRISGITRVEP